MQNKLISVLDDTNAETEEFVMTGLPGGIASTLQELFVSALVKFIAKSGDQFNLLPGFLMATIVEEGEDLIRKLLNCKALTTEQKQMLGLANNFSQATKLKLISSLVDGFSSKEQQQLTMELFKITQWDTEKKRILETFKTMPFETKQKMVLAVISSMPLRSVTELLSLEKLLGDGYSWW